METQKTVIQAKPVTLSADDQEEIITFVKDCWDKGKAERKKYMDHAKECEDAYHCRMEPIESPELDWMSNTCLPWAYDAAESWFAHIHSTTIPKNDQIFTISGRTEEDHPGADVMQKYLEYRFHRNKFAEQLGRAYQDLARKNHACLKVYWREDSTVEYNWVDEPVMGETLDEMGMPAIAPIGIKKVRKPETKTTFDNVWIDVVDLDCFVMYPTKGDINKTTRMEETYRYYEDLMADAKAGKNNYFNLSEISKDDEKNTEVLDKKNEVKNKTRGLRIKEAWIDRVKIGDQVYRNYLATIVNDKVLIRFQPFPPGCPKSPYVWMALRRDGDSLYGYGLNSKGLGILKSANRIFNSWIDEVNLTQHNAYKYYDDGVFNPYNVVRRPGAFTKLAGPESVAANLVPLIDDLSKQQQAMVDLQALKVEFETVTVPKVVKGMIEVERESTATEQNLAQNNASGKMHIDAYNINDGLIQPALELSYQAIYDRVQFEKADGSGPIIQEIQAVCQPKDPQTGAPLQELPILPLPEVDIKIVGYQNVIRKQEQLQNMGAALPQLVQSPAAPYIKWTNVAEDIFNLMDLDKDRLLMQDEERKAQDESQRAAAEEEKQMLVAEAMGKFEIEKQKLAQEFEIKQMELQLKAQELTLKQQELLLKEKEIECNCAAKQEQLAQSAEQAEHKANMDHHGAQMSERQQEFSENQAKKEKKDG